MTTVDFMPFRILTLLINTAFLCLSAAAQAKSLTITDHSGEPLEHVVVSIETAQTPAPETAVMDQIDRQFVPKVLAVPVGSPVTFPNSDNIRHHVYSFSQAKPFELKLYSGTAAEPVTFDKPGIVALGCNIHDQMIGYIYVYEHARVFITDKNGVAEVPDNAQSATLWHPELDIVQSKRETVPLDAGKPSETLTLTLNAVIPVESGKKSRTFGSKEFGSN